MTTELHPLSEILAPASQDVGRKTLAPLVDRSIQAFRDGMVQPIPAYIRLKAAIDALTRVCDDPDVKRAVHQHAVLYPPQDRRSVGCEFELRSLPDKWDFSGDQVWADLSAMVKVATAELKAREAVLKAAYESGAGAIPTTGEELRVTKIGGGEIVAVKL